VNFFSYEFLPANTSIPTVSTADDHSSSSRETTHNQRIRLIRSFVGKKKK
jgi:hypothetical protein